MKRILIIIILITIACSERSKVQMITESDAKTYQDTLVLQISDRDKSISYRELFKEFCTLVEDNFYSSKMVEEKFVPLKELYAKRVENVATDSGFSDLMNNMLIGLKTSHTYYLTPGDIEYYYLSDIFSSLPHIKKLFPGGVIKYPTIGITTEKTDSKDFITCVLAGSNAEKAGLLKGDEIISVEGAQYHPIHSLKDNINKEIVFVVKRSSGDGIQKITVMPTLLNPNEQFLEAEKKSINVIENLGKQIGYIHIFSYAGQQYHEILTDAVSWGELKDVDALIIDLRYGIGGASPAYLNLFNQNVPKLVSKDNKNNEYHFDPQWRKPVVYLTNKTTRSGKEILAYGAKQFKLATVIGESTAGAVVGGALYNLSNGNLLYLASRSVQVDGLTLEGVGVQPDIEISMDVRYCQGKDSQLEGALKYLSNKLTATQGQ